MKWIFFRSGGNLPVLGITPLSYRTVQTERTDHAFETLLENARTGDAVSRDLVLEQARSVILRTVLAREQDPRVAEELIQESVVRCVAGLSGLQATCQPQLRAWAASIAQNVWYEERRKQLKSRHLLARYEHHQNSAPVEAESPFGASDLRDALGQIPSQYAEVLELHYLQECSCQQIAELLGVPYGTVTSRLFRAKKAILKVLLQKKARRHD